MNNNRSQLAHTLNTIICNYNNNKLIERFYRKLNRLNKNIAIYITRDMFDEYKTINKYIYNCIINGEDDDTIINDCIYHLRKIMIALMLFE